MVTCPFFSSLCCVQSEGLLNWRSLANIYNLGVNVEEALTMCLLIRHTCLRREPLPTCNENGFHRLIKQNICRVDVYHPVSANGLGWPSKRRWYFVGCTLFIGHLLFKTKKQALKGKEQYLDGTRLEDSECLEVLME